MLRTLRKTKIHINLNYSHTFTHDLYAENVAAGVDETFTLRFDLNCNLRTRNKQTHSYLDARGLADGEISQLESLQFDNEDILKQISSMLAEVNLTPQTWRLIILLEGEHTFNVRPEFSKINNYSSITMHVII